jgi:ketosteroid isomerase-like protein
MEDRIALMRNRYGLFSAGDLEGATQEWAEDIVWRGPDSERVPGGGEHRGRDQALAHLGRAVAAWDEFDLAAETFLEDGETVVVIGHTAVRKDERSARIPVVHVWRWRGEQIASLHLITDSLQTVDVLGAS